MVLWRCSVLINGNSELWSFRMGKKVSEMSLEELWQLFPIFLTEHKLIWEQWYQEEKEQLKATLTGNFEINHIGSTAIDGICAKPIIDILVEIPSEVSINEIKAELELIGYYCHSQTDKRMSFNKGYTEDGFAEKVFHLHLRYLGDNDELYFRDYMLGNPIVAKQYEALKLSLWKKYEHDRDGYTNAKSEFILKYTEKAKNNYIDRYRRK